MEQLLAQIGNPLIAVIVPIVLYLLKKLIPALPPALLPILAAALGPAFDYAIAALAGLPASGATAVLYGLAGVGLRELQDQLRKSVLPVEPPKGTLGVLLLVLLVPMLLVGCAGTPANTQTQLLLACQGYGDAEKSLRPFKPKLSSGQVAVIRQSIEIAEPICTGEGDLGDPQAALDLVRGKLRDLVTVQNEVMP